MNEQHRVVEGDRVMITDIYKQKRLIGKTGVVDQVIPAMWDPDDHIVLIRLDDNTLMVRTFDRPGWLRVIGSKADVLG